MPIPLMNGTDKLMFPTTRKHPVLLSDLTGLVQKLASEMSGKWQRKLGGRDKGGRKKQRGQGKGLMEEKSRELCKRKERNHFMIPHNYRNVKGVQREGWLKEKKHRGGDMGGERGG